MMKIIKELKCNLCRKLFTVQIAVYRMRMKQAKGGRLFCSRECAGQDHWGRYYDPNKPKQEEGMKYG